MKRICVLSFCAGFFLISQRGYGQTSQQALTLKQAVERGITSNLQVQQAGLQAKTDEINWKQSKLNLLPNLNGSASSGVNQGRSIDPATNSYSNQQIGFASYGLNSGVVLFNGLVLRNSVKQNSLAYQASTMDWQQAKDNLTINIILAYLLVLNNEDLLLQSGNQAALTKKQVDRLTILDNDGAIAPYLLSDLKGQYANDQLTMINTRNLLETAKLSLCQLMNIPYDTAMQLERVSTESFMTKYDNSTDSIYKIALQQFSLIKAVDLRRQSAEKGVNVAKGGLYPTLSLNGSANTNYSNGARNDVFINTTDVVTTDYVVINGTNTPVVHTQRNFSSQKIAYGRQLNNNLFTTVSLNLRIPIFNSFQARNRIKLAAINLKNTEVIASTTKTQLQQFIGQAHINMTTAWERYKLLLDQVNWFEESFRAAEIRFNAGVGNSIDYLTAKNNLDRANTNLITAKYDYVLRTKILDYYQGKQLW
ncbi:MAG TPA: TolC family protein [Chitinophagaceae bacterium]|jgi:outer membrane protein|nr:TolC family protein [Chitinophagaceae bacterium]